MPLPAARAGGAFLRSPGEGPCVSGRLRGSGGPARGRRAIPHTTWVPIAYRSSRAGGLTLTRCSPGPLVTNTEAREVLERVNTSSHKC